MVRSKARLMWKQTVYDYFFRIDFLNDENWVRWRDNPFRFCSEQFLLLVQHYLLVGRPTRLSVEKLRDKNLDPFSLFWTRYCTYDVIALWKYDMLYSTVVFGKNSFPLWHWRLPFQKITFQTSHQSQRTYIFFSPLVLLTGNIRQYESKYKVKNYEWRTPGRRRW